MPVPSRSPLVADTTRTLRALFGDVVPYVLRLATQPPERLPTTATEEGLRSIRASFRRTLQKAGIDLEVRKEENVPAQGGLVLMWNQESHLDHLVLAAAIPR